MNNPRFFVNNSRALLLYCPARLFMRTGQQYNSPLVKFETRAEPPLSIVSNSRSESAKWSALCVRFMTDLMIKRLTNASNSKMG